MEAHGHALLASTITLGGINLLHISRPSAVTLLMGALAGSLLPDLDEPHSVVSKSLGVVSRIVGVIVKKVSGGHRNATHSIIGVVFFTLVAMLVANLNPIGLACVVGICAMLSVIGALPRIHSRHLLAVVVGAGVAYFTFTHSSVLNPTLISLAVGFGVVLHLCGDSLTPSGVKWFWPLKTSISAKFFYTGSLTEKVITALLLFTTAALLALYITPHSLNAIMNTSITYRKVITK